MRHPDQATLALHAGGDLGKFARWRLLRHLATCDSCAAEVAAFESMREMVADLSDLPDVPWDALAAEMKANVRLGLAAGECVRAGETSLRHPRWFTGMRGIVAWAVVVVLIAIGIVLQRPQTPSIAAVQTPTVEAVDNGIRLRAGGSAMGLMNHGVKNVSYLPNAQGGMSASYVSASGYVTVNTVYGQ